MLITHLLKVTEDCFVLCEAAKFLALKTDVDGADYEVPSPAQLSPSLLLCGAATIHILGLCSQLTSEKWPETKIALTSPDIYYSQTMPAVVIHLPTELIKIPPPLPVV